MITCLVSRPPPPAEAVPPRPSEARWLQVHLGTLANGKAHTRTNHTPKYILEHTHFWMVANEHATHARGTQTTPSHSTAMCAPALSPAVPAARYSSLSHSARHVSGAASRACCTVVPVRRSSASSCRSAPQLWEHNSSRQQACVPICVYMHVRVHVCACAYVGVCVCVQVCVHGCVYAGMHQLSQLLLGLQRLLGDAPTAHKGARQRAQRWRGCYNVCGASLSSSCSHNGRWGSGLGGIWWIG